jgi:mono/diheme cytochrome c family protein
MNMKSKMIVGLVAMTTLAALLLLLRPVKRAEAKRPAALTPQTVGVGKLLANFSAKALDGATVSLTGASGTKATVIALTGLDCPVCKRYGPALARIEDTYATKGIRFIFVNPAKTESVAQMKATVKQLGLNGPYIHDKSGELVGLLKATSTAEVFVLDAKRTVVYRGALDDQYGIGYSNNAPKHTYVKDALDAVLRNELPPLGATAAPGCYLEPTEVKTSAPASTYHNRISRIVQTNCQSCHRAGGAAPFNLESYSAVKDRAKMVQYVVEKGMMPPWFAAPEKKSPWKNDRSLTPEDRKALLDWVAAGMPEGNPKDAPLPVKFPSNWQIGTPDAVFQLPKPVKVKAEGTMPYQSVIVPVGFSEDKWIQAMEVKPTAKQVVHHVLVFVAPKSEGGSRRGRLSDEAAERSGFFAIYVPGNSTLLYPEGFAKRIPAGANLRFQIHYTPNGKAVEDQSQIGLVFAKKAPEHEVKTTGIANLRISIPPGAENHKEVAQIPIPVDVKILSYLPHMHLRGKACRYELVSSEGKRELLLDIPRYDFNWQLQYDYSEPKAVTRGSKVEFTVWYDNSSKNPANPDPTKTVRWGSQTFDEMHLGYVEYYVPGAKPGEAAPGIGRGRPSLGGLLRGRNQNQGTGSNPIEQRFRQLDRNGDGFLTQSEVGAFWSRLGQADTNNDGKVTLEEAKKSFGGG